MSLRLWFFGAAQMAGVLEPEWAKALTLAVALSMAATPIFLVLLTRMEKTATGEAREADEIDEEPAAGYCGRVWTIWADSRAFAAVERGEDGGARSRPRSYRNAA